LHTFLRHPLHIFSSGGPPPARTHPGPIRSRAKPAGESRHRWDTVAILFAGISIQRDNHTLHRHPHTTRAFARRYPYTSAGTPHPARAFMRDTRIPRWHPTPPAPSPAGYPYTSAGTPTPPAPSQGYPYILYRQPPPRPRLRRSSPAPSRRAGAVLAIPGGKPSPGWSRWAAVHWTVGISRLGARLTGRGNSFPLPCLSRSKHLASRRQPPPRPRLQRSSREKAMAVPGRISGGQPYHGVRCWRRSPGGCRPGAGPSPGSLTIRAKSQKERGAAGELRRQRRGL